LIHGLERRKLTAVEREYVSDGFVEPSSRKDSKDMLAEVSDENVLNDAVLEHVAMFDDMILNAAKTATRDPPLPLYLQENVAELSIPMDHSFGFMPNFSLLEAPVVPSNYYLSGLNDLQLFPELSPFGSYGIPLYTIPLVLDSIFS
jgi:hypothetical protein